MNISKVVAIFAFSLIAFMPLTAQAFLAVGGRVITVTACVTPPGAFLTTLATYRGPVSYLWTPTIPYLQQTPPLIGQSVIALLGVTPIPCFGVGLGPPLGAGLPILFLLHGSSLR